MSVGLAAVARPAVAKVVFNPAVEVRCSRFTDPSPAPNAGRGGPSAGGRSFGQVDENEGSFLITGFIPDIDVPGREAAVLDVPGRDLRGLLDFSGDRERGWWWSLSQSPLSLSLSLSLSRSRTENVVPSRINDRARLCSRLYPPREIILCFLDDALSLPPCCDWPGGGGGGTTGANLFLFLFSTAWESTSARLFFTLFEICGESSGFGRRKEAFWVRIWLSLDVFVGVRSACF